MAKIEYTKKYEGSDDIMEMLSKVFIIVKEDEF